MLLRLQEIKLIFFTHLSRYLSSVFLLVSLIPSTGYTYSSLSIWEVLNQQFSLNHETSRPEVQAQIHWLLQHPNYVRQFTKSEPYLYHIMTEIQKRHLPGELALIPMVESAYNPFAYSGAGAAGLWQLMPGTGLDLGLKQDWWYDGRRSIPSSTHAALNYLEYLHHYFNNNWILAFAAYDAGEGAIARLVKENHHQNFWALPVPKETRAYVPRILALAEIIQNAQHYHIQLPDIAPIPYFKEVSIGSQIDLNHAAQLAEIPYQDLLKLNPGYNRWATAPNQPYKLLIPAQNVALFGRNLATVPANKRVSWTRHKVNKDDTLSGIAARYNTTVNMLKELNQLKTNTIPAGQYLLIPNHRYATSSSHQPVHFTKPAFYKSIYITDKKDSFGVIAKKFHVSEEQIKAWNDLSDPKELRAGQSLIIWRSYQDTSYVVKSGDSLHKIASAHQTTLKQLLFLNQNLRVSQLRAGQVIRVH